MKKIMFNDTYLLTQAVLEGRKTMTRRIIDKKKNEYFLNLLSDEEYMKHTGTLSYDDEFGEFRIDDVYECTTCRPMYKIGEVVAVAQKYSEVINPIDWVHTKIYQLEKGWNNKMFVKADLMPHQIRITDIKIEKLQDISDEDCIAEGVGISKTDNRVGHPFAIPFNYFIGEDTKNNRYTTPREAFAALIDKVSGKGTWESNPYVFAYSFELVK